MRFQLLIVNSTPRYEHLVCKEIPDRSHWTSKQETFQMPRNGLFRACQHVEEKG